MNANQQFMLALVSPIGITVMGLMIGSNGMFAIGLVFTGAIIFARWLNSHP